MTLQLDDSSVLLLPPQLPDCGVELPHIELLFRIEGFCRVMGNEAPTQLVAYCGFVSADVYPLLRRLEQENVIVHSLYEISKLALQDYPDEKRLEILQQWAWNYCVHYDLIDKGQALMRSLASYRDSILTELDQQLCNGSP